MQMTGEYNKAIRTPEQIHVMNIFVEVIMIEIFRLINIRLIRFTCCNPKHFD
jgi:hypothetical protein